MTRKSNKKLLSLILSMMLIVAMAFSMTACSDNNTETGSNTETEAVNPGDAQNSIPDTQDDAVEQETSDAADATVVGEGSTIFTFVVVDKDGNETTFEVHTDKTTVGEALQEVELIAGEVGDYGLFVTEVNGITADGTDGAYWMLYINGEMAPTGVDSTNIEEGVTYSFKAEKY